ncbi:MAG TPA: hypothetical protein VM243_15645 [Phycisphaerae bacterium]|nr:hypothetical protein [Phycisphaerae bacterium]
MLGGLLPDPLVMVDRTDLGEAPADEDEYPYHRISQMNSSRWHDMRRFAP